MVDIYVDSTLLSALSGICVHIQLQSSPILSFVLTHNSKLLDNSEWLSFSPTVPRGQNGACGYILTPVDANHTKFVWIVNADLKVGSRVGSCKLYYYMALTLKV